MDPGDDGLLERVRVTFSTHPPLTFVVVENVSAFGVRTLGSASAALGRGDVWDTNAGMRVAFDRFLRRYHGKLPAGFMRSLRRAVQVELALDRIDRKGKALEAAMERLAAEHAALLEAKRNGYFPPGPKTPLFYRPAEGPPKVKQQTIAKPDAYKSTHDGEPATLFGYPVLLGDLPRDLTGTDRPPDATGDCMELAVEDLHGLGPNQTGR